MLSLKSDPQSLNLDLKGLATEMANMVLSNASDNLDYIQGLIKQNKDPEKQRPLAYCAEAYIPVVKYNLPQAIEALSNGHYGFANYGISDAANGADACEKNFPCCNTSPLTERNKLVHNLSEIAVAIINVLWKKG
ncbi:putative invertase inhibitor [Tripterygium wilfordii]|uniref:Putative invertase inhibitor n=2 Tax=Tripterygium wilfordii TaxID=458696 RepID=A0A7J7CSJ7_TRIWF|nr:putative invertase inhibitor [Tripterygium wilfordii]